ncbi:hypothetical protein JTE90_016824 [Oedothorax gibbosus]|uniref:Lipase n=1 Tax=Oedothorax gibbosus TaxID=931172 RepID=A0AAV6VZQ8_9ARAC|nr:hypothetical protein JTE90_016824 [Oedothorax gibbosus]
MRAYAFLTVIAIFVTNCSCQSVWDDVTDLLNLKKDPDSGRNVTQLITSKGYPAENHIVQTKDGYLLSIQRIPSGRSKWLSERHNQNKKVVFLQHGLLSSSTDWVLNFPDESLAFILADAGYDVWLGNIRGNTYSRRHVKYSPKSKIFWQFSFDEMAEYDLPAMIDYVLNITGQKQLSYIGHSQGTTTAFAMLSQKPEYNQKINIFIALAPVTTVGHMTSAIRYLAPFTKDIDFLFKILGVSEFLPNNALMKFLSELVCNTKAKFICEDAIFLLCGTDYSQLNQTRLEVYVAHTPAGASTQSIIHYAQMVNSKKFLKYDFGKKENLKRYNQTTPPEYHVQNITTKVALFWSKNDQLADPQDVELLHKSLKTCVSSYCIKFNSFNHLDFVWAIDANTLLYGEVQSLLKKYS